MLGVESVMRAGPPEHVASPGASCSAARRGALNLHLFGNPVKERGVLIGLGSASWLNTAPAAKCAMPVHARRNARGKRRKRIPKTSATNFWR
jgi:hypothetical protein